MHKQIINNEKFTSIQQVQAGLAKLLELASKKGNFYRVMRNNKPLGVLLPNNLWASLMEDLEALSSTTYLENIEKARKGKQRHSAKEVKKTLGL